MTASNFRAAKLKSVEVGTVGNSGVGNSIPSQPFHDGLRPGRVLVMQCNVIPAQRGSESPIAKL